ncbi:D-serine ammonia-lyase [Sporolactobacillus terrae]|uniref:D-serine ammonia-lyase n=1 Tax=Sporolactobacillus terrae TaxID=269673 RepID=UPI00111A8678|nr:D-serine ammonia-lyase [Sporolactobacillus terrae]
MDQRIGTSARAQWEKSEPVIRALEACEDVLWLNPAYGQQTASLVSADDVADAEARLRRFAPYLVKVFPETRGSEGIIESPIYALPSFQKWLEQREKMKAPGTFIMKADSELPISGSIKARGGIYEVLKTAEDLAIRAGRLSKNENYACLAEPTFRAFFANYALAVGSTGNLGLSIGIVGAKLGFQTTVHMSRDASAWKKRMLRKQGASVKEYESDYSKAVQEGRKQARQDPHCHFIDDEQSNDLFVGYATAGARLQRQLSKSGVVVDRDHPLFVYLPCGVGGAPGGVTLGLKQVFGDAVHVFFVEPTHAPCFLLGLLTGLHDKVSVCDFGLDNRTAADGLAVPRPSAFAGKAVGSLISGCMTVQDSDLFRILKALKDTENHWIEPSAAAGFIGPKRLLSTKEGKRYLERHELVAKMNQAVHLFWATGGGMVPQKNRDAYYNQASRI